MKVHTSTKRWIGAVSLLPSVATAAIISSSSAAILGIYFNKNKYVFNVPYKLLFPQVTAESANTTAQISTQPPSNCISVILQIVANNLLQLPFA